MNTEGIVYLLRKTSLTRAEIGKLSPAQFSEIIKEVSFQESLDNYRNQYSVASLMAAIYNTIPRKHGAKALRAEDFLSRGMPERNPRQQDSLDKMAGVRGVRLPTRELRER